MAFAVRFLLPAGATLLVLVAHVAALWHAYVEPLHLPGA